MMPEDTAVKAEALRALFAQHADPVRAAPMAAYMKNHFPFFGLPTPQRRALMKPWLVALGRSPQAGVVLNLAKALWRYPERECQYAAVDVLVKHAQCLRAAQEPGLARLVCEKSWWDSVDLLAGRVYGTLLMQCPELLPRIETYAEADNLWLRRVALLFQLHYGAQTDCARLSWILSANLAHPDFFIRKAMGWALRQYAYTDADWVRHWLKAHGAAVPALTRREAAKHL